MNINHLKTQPPAIDVKPIVSKLKSIYPNLPEVDFAISTPLVYDPMTYDPLIGMMVKFKNGTSCINRISADALENSKESDDFLYTTMAYALLFDLLLAIKKTNE